MVNSIYSDVFDIKDVELKMRNMVEMFASELSNIHVTRPSVDYMNKVIIMENNKSVMLRSVAVVSVFDAKTLHIEFSNKDIILKFDKKIREFGLSTQTEGKILKVFYIDLVGDRRSKLVKEISNLEEHRKVMLRALRQDCNNTIKKMFKDKNANDDNIRSLTKKVQTLTDLHIGQVSTISKCKKSTLQC